MTFEELRELLRGRRVARGRDRLTAYGECWIFTGARNEDGYGLIRRTGFSGSARHAAMTRHAGRTLAHAPRKGKT